MNIVANTSIAAIRAQPSERSEMVSQMLFGELAEVLKKQDNWLNVRLLWDETVGWMDARQTTPITPSETVFYQNNHAHSLALTEPVMSDNYFMPVLIGSMLPGFDGIRFKIGERNFTFSGQTIFSNPAQPTGELLSRIAHCTIGRSSLVHRKRGLPRSRHSRDGDLRRGRIPPRAASGVRHRAELSAAESVRLDAPAHGTGDG